MDKLYHTPAVFIHYPTGSGGWFLSAIIHYAFDPSWKFRFDHVGSGHANDHVRYINNFYTEVTLTKTYERIMEDKDYDVLSWQDRIDYLRESITVNRTDIPQTISLHCKNINVFLEAFPNSKCIQINIDPDDLMHCTANFLYKRLLTRTLFDVFYEKNNQPMDQIDLAYEKFQNITDSKENLDYFSWAQSYVLNTAKNLDNDARYDDRILEIMFKEYMLDDIDSVLTAMLNFAGVKYDQTVYDEIYGYVMRYRNEQPKFKRS